MNENSIKHKISKLTLGAVQLGMDYGIANKQGKPSKQDSFNLLSETLENEVTAIDTARHYGSSESVIGEFSEREKFTIITKFKLDRNLLKNKQQCVDEALRSVEDSCKNLHVNRIPVLLFHQDKDYPIDIVADLLPFVIARLKAEGLIDMGGISVYHPSELAYIKNWQEIQAVQVPMNIFDLRLIQNGLMEVLIKNNVLVFIRSVFLQGLLLMNQDSLPSHLEFARPYLTQLTDLEAEAKLDVAQMALAFVRDTPGVSSIVIGAENASQVKQNCALLKTPSLSADIRMQIEKLFIDVPEKLITPGYWGI